MKISYCFLILVLILSIYLKDASGQVDLKECPDYYEPVCGDDAKTYTNPCHARNAGVQNYIDGECWFPDDGVFAVFGFFGEPYTFRMYISNEQAIEDVIGNCLGLNGKHIPTGTIMNGTLFDDQWSYFLDPDSIVMTTLAVEVCDGSPMYVEENLEYWLNLGFWCPWAAHVIEIDGIGECVNNKEEHVTNLISSQETNAS